MTSQPSGGPVTPEYPPFLRTAGIPAAICVAVIVVPVTVGATIHSPSLFLPAFVGTLMIALFAAPLLGLAVYAVRAWIAFVRAGARNVSALIRDRRPHL